jgi:hypothetical protein
VYSQQLSGTFDKIDGILLEMFYKVRHYSFIYNNNYTIISIKNYSFLSVVFHRNKIQCRFLTLLKHY